MKKKSVQKIAGYIFSFILATIFLYHGILGISAHEPFRALIEYVGFSASISSTLLIITGIIDLCVAFLVFFYPRWWNLLWAGLWPIIPITLSTISGNGSALGELVLAPTLAFIVYWLRVKE